ncbi:GNAT family N-acetyltransferase [Bacillus cereus]|uniref:GNAT family N-acetyltransferase n=1 Tax=Bacillus cereus TaxID=1396 RepID=UPI002ED86C2C
MNKNISFRRANMEEDFEKLHSWMNNKHVIPFWRLNMSKDLYKIHLDNALKDTHQTLYIGYLDNIPMSYWEAYYVKGDIIEKYYDYDEHDQGIHLLIGPEQYLGKGYALPLLKAMVTFQFQNKKTQKIIAEPDINNKKMIHVFERCGFKAIKSIDLPDKTGLLMFCSRIEFEGALVNGYV